MVPKFSITLCSYNSVEYIQQCIDSLLSQTMKDFELIIVDDGSTDGTVKYLKSLSDTRIRLFVLKKNHGLIYARSQAFNAARAEYIALMDADDIAHPQRLEEQLRVLDEGHVDVCGTRYQTLETATNRLRERKAYSKDADIRALLTIYCPICNPTVSFRRKLLNITGYQEEFSHAEDYAFWTALAGAGSVFHIIPLNLLTYRIHPQQISRVKSQAARASFLKAQQKYMCAVFDGDQAPQSMPFIQRMKTGLRFMLSLNRKFPGVTVGANYEIYAEFQFRGNGWLTPFMRLERLTISLLATFIGKHSST